MKRFARRILALVVAVTIMVGVCHPCADASYIKDSYFDTVSILLDEGHMYLVCDNQTKVRTRPCEEGDVVMTLPNNTLVYSENIVINRAGNRWIQTSTGYIWSEHLKSHTHSWMDISVLVPGFSSCPECGKIVATSSLSSSIPVSDYMHLTLDIMSLFPGVGDGADIINSVMYLSEGNYQDAISQLATALAVAYIADYFQTAKTVQKIEKYYEAYDKTVVFESLPDDPNSVRIYEKGSSTKLAKSMDQAFDMTGMARYDKNIVIIDGKRTIAAHHIIPAEMKEAAEARQILHYLDIGINGAENGVYLCMESSNCLEGAEHIGRHSIEYVETVNESIVNAFHSVSGYEKQRKAVTNELERLAGELRSGKLVLR